MTDALKILYVDDEPDIRVIVEMSLGLDPQMDVRLVGSGQEALALFDRGDWYPDLALLDMMMPGMSGADLLNALRARPDTRHIPAVFVTASARSSDMDRYIAMGAVGVISKPFDPMTLARTVRDYALKFGRKG